MSKLMFSQSGIRGTVGGTLTPDLIQKVAMSFGRFNGKGPIIVGGDTRTSHDSIKHIVIGALCAVGTDVIDIGKVTTPTVQHMIREHQAAGGIVITASHNPIIWNGLKLMNDTGSFLNQREYKAFMELYAEGPIELADWQHVGQISTDPEATEKHINRIFENIDISVIQNAQLKVFIDANNGAGCVANSILLDRLGVTYTAINSEPNGHFKHDPEPLQINLLDTIAQMKKGKYDIGFIQDADADRLVILDETAHFIGEDYSLAFCIDHVLETSKDPYKIIVVNLSTSNVIDALATKHDANLIRTKIGETNVTQEIKRREATVGGEGNGGIIYPNVGWGRDSLVGITLALRHLAIKKQKLSQIISSYPSFIMLREKITLDSSINIEEILQSIENHFKNDTINKEDGIKIIRKDQWIHIRPSNTEPILRIFIEAKTDLIAKKELENVFKIINK